MLGCIASNNDVFIYFERREIDALPRGSLQGWFALSSNPTLVPLEVTLCEQLPERVKAMGEPDGRGSWTSFTVRMSRPEYDRFNERRRYELHEGWRHVSFIDVERMDSLGQIGTYQQLCHYRAQQRSI